MIPQFRRQRGFTLAELMIASTISILILAGMASLFVNNSRAQSEIEKTNRQVENGRYAIQILGGDLRNAGFFGAFDPTRLPVPTAVPAPCSTDLDVHKGALQLHLQGYDNVSASVLPCLTDVLAGTDVLVVRHASTCALGEDGCDPASAGGPFFQASLCSNESELGSGDIEDHYGVAIDSSTLTLESADCEDVPGAGTTAPVRRLLSHIYFIANNSTEGDGIPTLKRAELGTADGALTLTIVPLAEGIENLQIEYGLDTDTSGTADVFSTDPAVHNGCADATCAVANWRAVVSTKLNLLAKNSEATTGHTDTKSYILGATSNGAPNTVAAKNDAFKRHVFQSVVIMPNPSGRRTP